MQKIGNKVATNAMWIIGCHIVQALISFVISIFTAKYLGPSNYGVISYVSSVAAFLLPVMKLGLDAVLVQEIINKPDKEGETIGTATILNVLAAFFCMLSMFCFLSFANAGEKETIIVGILYSVSILFQSVEAVRFWYQAKYLSKYASLFSLVAYVIVAIYKVYILVAGKSIYWFAITNAIDYLLIAVMMLIFYYRLGGQGFSFSKTRARELLLKGRYYIVSALMVSIFVNTDRIMIKNMVGDAEAGYYAVAAALVQYTSFVFVAIINSMRPTILESKKNNEEKYEQKLVYLYSMVIYISLFISVVFTMFSDFVISYLYGEIYANSIPILRILAWYTAFSYLGGAKDVWILAENKQKYLLYLNMIGVVVNVVLNYFFIQLGGGVGAASASLLTQVITNFVCMFAIIPLRKNGTLILRALNPTNLIQITSILIKKETNYE